MRFVWRDRGEFQIHWTFHGIPFEMQFFVCLSFFLHSFFRVHYLFCGKYVFWCNPIKNFGSKSLSTLLIQCLRMRLCVRITFIPLKICHSNETLFHVQMGWKNVWVENWLLVVVWFRTVFCTQEIESFSKHSCKMVCSVDGTVEAKATLNKAQVTMNTFILIKFVWYFLIFFTKEN